MEVLWQAAGEERTGRQVAEALPDHAYTTVSTVLDRLSRKGLVRRGKTDRRRSYASTGTEADHAATLMREALQDAHDQAEAMAAFVSSMKPTALAELRRAVDVAEGDQVVASESTVS